MEEYKEQTPLSSDTFNRIVNMMRTSIVDQTESIAGDEEKAQVTGLRRSLEVVDEVGEAGSVGLALYREAERGHMGAILRQQDFDVQQPKGHIEFIKSRGDAHISGSLYLDAEDNQIKVFVSAKKAEPEAHPDNWGCYDFADQLGLGDIWTGVTATSEYAQIDRPFDEHMASRLEQLLNSFQNVD